MPINFNCPGCGKGYSVPDGVGGKSTKCRACGAAITIPMASEAPVAVPSMEPAAPARSGGGSGIKKIAFLAVALLVVVALGYTAYALLGSSGPPGMTYMPNDTQILVSVRVADAVKSGVWADVKKDNPDVAKELDAFFKDAPFQLEDMAQMLWGVSDLSSKQMVMVLEFKKSVKLEDMIAFLEKKSLRPSKFTESKVGSYTVKGDDTSSFCQISSNLIVGGPPDAVKAVLERDKKPSFSEGMQKALKDADLSQTVAVAVNFKALAQNPMVAGTVQQANVSGDSVETVVVNMNVSSDLRVSSVGVCKDAKTADEFRKMAEGGIVMLKKMVGEAMPKEVVDVLDTIKIAAKDNRLTADVTIKVAPLLPLAKEAIGKPAQKEFKTVGQTIRARD